MDNSTFPTKTIPILPKPSMPKPSMPKPSMKSTIRTPRRDSKKQCPSCPYSSIYSSTFKRHLATHTELKCICEFSTEKKGNSSIRHVMSCPYSTNCSSTISCDCGKTFKYKVRLQVRIYSVLIELLSSFYQVFYWSHAVLIVFLFRLLSFCPFFSGFFNFGLMRFTFSMLT